MKKNKMMKSNNGNQIYPTQRRITLTELLYGTKPTPIYVQPSFSLFPIIKQAILNGNLKNVSGDVLDYDIHRKPIPGSINSIIADLIKKNKESTFKGQNH